MSARDPRAIEARNAAARSALPVVAAVSAAGCLPLALAREPVFFVAWLALVAPAAGAFAARARLSAWPWAPCVPALWMAALALATAASERPIATPTWVACVWTGLYFAGFGAEALLRPRAAGFAPWLLLAVPAWCALPLGFGWSATTFTPEWTARLLELSPLRWSLEAASVDWLHHAAFYERARTFDLGPELVRANRPELAGGGVLLLGCALAGAGVLASRARRAPRISSLPPA